MAEIVATSGESQLDFLAAGGEMAERIRQFDWSRTPLGGIERWSPALRTMVQFILANGFPQLLWWGPEYIQFYNDPYRPIPGAKHPHVALGRPARECWAEIFHIIGPLIDTPFHGGPATWDEDILLEINRHGFLEESHFTIAYSPVPDETVPGGIGGVLATVHEITGKVVGERRIEVLRDLGARVSEAKTAEDASVIVADTLARHNKDVPFAMLYLVEPKSGQAHLAGVAGVEAGDPISPRVIDLAAPNASAWPLDTSGALDLQVVEGLQARFASVPPGPWSDAPRAAVVVPIPATKQQELAGFLIVGVSARLGFDQAYRGFLELMRTQVATSLANARAYDEERRRAEELAALDLAKTHFFSNVSHEFRTPLTLMLGPVEDVLGDADCVTPVVRKQLEVAHRNSLRLLRLVNTMLEFTRIEAGRASASYAPVDLPELTAELASSFRSACERAGVRLVINCPQLPAGKQAFVDIDMWEKVVLNLVSNAFKFTLEGEIEVRLEALSSNEIRLVVRDTGLGIPAEELPRMFDRFHRVHNAAARTHEGTGIGLALVNELAKLHGGTVAVDSVLGEGSQFTVTIPLGNAHLDPAHVQAAATAPHLLTANAFVEEAMRWLPDADTMLYANIPRVAAEAATMPPGAREGARPRIVWADDNTDMRQYVARLLSEHYDVEAVADGEAALAAARRQAPDLVLTDVMMPNMDGFELLRELRATPGLKQVPVVMVSARAGEESRIVGLEAGADDYLIKPFSARELVARVDANLRVVLLRRAVEAERRESEAQINRANDELNQRVTELERANEEVQESRKTALSLMVDALLAKEQLRDADRRKDEFLATLAHELRNPLAPVRNAVAIMKLKGPPVPELRWAQDVIERQMQQMSRLVDDLLDVSRISRGKIELKRERLELAKVIQGAVEASRPLMEQRAHQLSVTMPTETIYLDADETRLIQVFCNLLNNAAKYSANRGQIAIIASHDGVSVAVRVRDTGFGIPDDVLPRVFDMFTQADKTLEGAKGGLGVGLTLVKRLIELHGGVVEAHSEGLGKGSEFVVRLPILVDVTPATPADHVPGLISTVVPHRILVVDDNRDAADSMAMMLQILGNEVRTAYDGIEAVRAAGEFRPQVVLLDIGLPRLNGYETAERIRQESWGKSMVLAAVTGWGQKEDRRRSSEAGFDHHLVKPVAPTTLVELLSALPPMPGEQPRDLVVLSERNGDRNDHANGSDSPSVGGAESALTTM